MKRRMWQQEEMIVGLNKDNRDRHQFCKISSDIFTVQQEISYDSNKVITVYSKEKGKLYCIDGRACFGGHETDNYSYFYLQPLYRNWDHNPHYFLILPSSLARKRSNVILR